jgi:hypothetical protein
MGRAFISYKTNAKPDDRLAKFLAEYLTDRNHEIFIQTKIAPGQNWPSIVDTELKQADFLIVLLSDQAGGSEMVIEEVRRASHLRETQGRPVIIPVHLAQQVNVPYDLGAKVNRLERLKWLADGDEIAVAKKLDDALSTGQVVASQPAQPVQAGALSADGGVASATGQMACPLPAFDVSWLKSLDAQGGPVRLESPFYVARPHDDTARQRIVEKGRTLLLRGSRQIGKSSLLARLYQHALDNKVRTVYIDFQMFDHTQLQSLDKLLLSIGNQIGDDLNANNLPDATWKAARTPQQNLTRYLQEEIIGATTDPIVLLMDEVDRLFAFPDYRDDFFALVRYWHSRRAIDPRLARLNLVLAYSTEASMFIKNANQSPFNVGEVFELGDFTRPQFEQLNFKHGTPVKSATDIDKLLEIIGGHPFLVRQSLYELATSALSVKDLIANAADDDGPFGGHLQPYLLRFNEFADLKQAMKSVLQNGVCPDDVSFHRLRSIGLVRGPDRTHVTARCGLYGRYFGARL